MTCRQTERNNAQYEMPWWEQFLYLIQEQAAVGASLAAGLRGEVQQQAISGFIRSIVRRFRERPMTPLVNYFANHLSVQEILHLNICLEFLANIRRF